MELAFVVIYFVSNKKFDGKYTETQKRVLSKNVSIFICH